MIGINLKQLIVGAIVGYCLLFAEQASRADVAKADIVLTSITNGYTTEAILQTSGGDDDGNLGDDNILLSDEGTTDLTYRTGWKYYKLHFSASQSGNLSFHHTEHAYADSDSTLISTGICDMTIGIIHFPANADAYGTGTGLVYDEHTNGGDVTVGGVSAFDLYYYLSATIHEK